MPIFASRLYLCPPQPSFGIPSAFDAASSLPQPDKQRTVLSILL